MKQGVATKLTDSEPQHTVLFGYWPNLYSKPWLKIRSSLMDVQNICDISAAIFGSQDEDLD